MPWWGARAVKAPRLTNALTHAPKLSNAGKRWAGLAPERDAPRFAHQSFRKWFAGRGPSTRSRGRGRVLLWPDTFTNLFEPDVGKAAVDVLEAAGFEVEIPEKRLCCGRPLYDFGMLGLAKRTLRRTLDALSEPIEAGVPVLVLEPSCAAVFRDELRKLLPHDEHARRLVAQTLVLDEVLDRYAPDWELPRLEGEALMHGHCHHEAVIGVDGERRMLKRTGIRLDGLKAGCCGLAGSFGYQAGDLYEVSLAAGERVLFPAVRAAPDGALVVADGFSCRAQIATGTGRRALHSAQLLQRALQASA
jgi:Fe-S oxidoreductase